MSMYTTGEIAKLCNVTVRTVQYYDTRNILIPSELTEGGRRLYTEDDLKRMKLICFLRDVGVSINSIEELLAEANPENVISVLLEQQQQILEEEVKERQEKVKRLEDLQKELKDMKNLSVDTITDIACGMDDKKKMKKLHATFLAIGIPISMLQWVGFIYSLMSGYWWVYLGSILVAFPPGIAISIYYFNHISYICPQCHAVFNPSRREVFFANHTPTMRKLTCTCCGHKGFCIETYRKENK